MSAMKSASLPAKVSQKLPPTPPGHLLLGHLQEYRKDLLGYERHITRTYGPVVHVRFANRNAFVITGPDEVKQILVDQADKFVKAPIYREVLSRFLGNGMLTTDGD